MSIYASLTGIDADAPCGPPWVYQGSHILPVDDDPRVGGISLAEIPSHITRDGRDDQPGDGVPWPWLRVAIDTATDDPAVVISPAQARHLAQQLTDWADQAQPTTTEALHDEDGDPICTCTRGERCATCKAEEQPETAEKAAGQCSADSL